MDASNYLEAALLATPPWAIALSSTSLSGCTNRYSRATFSAVDLLILVYTSVGVHVVRTGGEDPPTRPKHRFGKAPLDGAHPSPRGSIWIRSIGTIRADRHPVQSNPITSLFLDGARRGNVTIHRDDSRNRRVPFQVLHSGWSVRRRASAARHNAATRGRRRSPEIVSAPSWGDPCML